MSLCEYSEFILDNCQRCQSVARLNIGEAGDLICDRFCVLLDPMVPITCLSSNGQVRANARSLGSPITIGIPGEISCYRFHSCSYAGEIWFNNVVSTLDVHRSNSRTAGHMAIVLSGFGCMWMLLVTQELCVLSWRKLWC